MILLPPKLDSLLELEPAQLGGVESLPRGDTEMETGKPRDPENFCFGGFGGEMFWVF